MHDPNIVNEQVRRWAEKVVVGLNLCPFAADPLERGKVRVVCSRAADLGELLAELMHETDILRAPDAEAETTLLATPGLLADFDDFLDATAAAEALLAAEGLDDRFQLAHFHPDYQFDGLTADDPRNLTNRSPHPVLHILRWTDVRRAMHAHPSVAQIPIDNQKKLAELGTRGVQCIDLQLALAPHKCWDTHTQAIFEAKGEALEDCMLQTRAELEEFARFISDKNIRSYLEIGVWTGRLITTLHRVFDFDTLAAADHCWAEENGFSISLPQKTNFFRGNSSGDEFLAWRAALGHIDLVMIDGDHSYRGVKRDFEIQRTFPHRFLSFHDITGANRGTRGVQKLWSELVGHKREVVHPHLEAGFDTPTMGIGIWSETEDPH